MKKTKRLETTKAKSKRVKEQNADGYQDDGSPLSKEKIANMPYGACKEVCKRRTGLRQTQLQLNLEVYLKETLKPLRR